MSGDDASHDVQAWWIVRDQMGEVATTLSERLPTLRTVGHFGGRTARSQN